MPKTRCRYAQTNQKRYICRVPRSKVQGIYNTARRKIADALVHAKILEIPGGQGKFVECGRCGKPCGSGCSNHCHRRFMQKITGGFLDENCSYI